MDLKNIIILLIILLIIILILYLYILFKNHNNKYLLKKKKKVRFNNNIQYHKYPKEIKLDYHDNIYNNIDYVEPFVGNIDENTYYNEDDINNIKQKVKYADLSLGEINKLRYNNMRKKNKQFQNSLDNFTHFQKDDSKIVEQKSESIDPFNPSCDSEKLIGMTIQDIYDSQINGPKAIPKNIKKITSSSIIYDNESELNGGFINGSNIYGMGQDDKYSSAHFTDNF